MKILLDSGIFMHSEFAEDAQQQRTVRWGNIEPRVAVQGFKRKKQDADPDYQFQKNALFTVGRLIREGRIDAFDYNEISFERMRGRRPIRQHYALQECNIQRCIPAVERSKFSQTIRFGEAISKGGRKDRDAGSDFGEFTQIAFLSGSTA